MLVWRSLDFHPSERYFALEFKDMSSEFAIILIELFYFQSTLLSTLTKTESEAANYEFTTLTCIPGVIEYHGANIQLLDLPVNFFTVLTIRVRLAEI